VTHVNDFLDTTESDASNEINNFHKMQANTIRFRLITTETAIIANAHRVQNFSINSWTRQRPLIQNSNYGSKTIKYGSIVNIFYGLAKCKCSMYMPRISIAVKQHALDVSGRTLECSPLISYYPSPPSCKSNYSLTHCIVNNRPNIPSNNLFFLRCRCLCLKALCSTQRLLSIVPSHSYPTHINANSIMLLFPHFSRNILSHSPTQPS